MVPVISNARPQMIYYIDVDDTLIRTVGNIVIPIIDTVNWAKGVDLTKNILYLWSRGGADYAKGIAAKLGISELFTAFLSKPDTLIDDQDIKDWSHLRVHHPSSLPIYDVA